MHQSLVTYIIMIKNQHTLTLLCLMRNTKFPSQQGTEFEMVTSHKDIITPCIECKKMTKTVIQLIHIVRYFQCQQGPAQ